MTLNEFSKIYGVKEATVKKNMEKIPGVEYVNREYRIIDGTRYFYSTQTKINDNFDRLLLILKALNKNKYIDNQMLKCTENDFKYLLEQLVNKKLIEENNSQNRYGTNGYNITITGMEYANKEKRAALKDFARIFGTFVGSACKEMMNQ